MDCKADPPGKQQKQIPHTIRNARESVPFGFAPFGLAPFGLAQDRQGRQGGRNDALGGGRKQKGDAKFECRGAAGRRGDHPIGQLATRARTRPKGRRLLCSASSAAET